MMTVNDVIAQKVRVLLRDTDEGGILWKDPELLMLLNEGCLEVARIRPAASSATINFDLNTGALQRLPSDCIMLLEVLCNQVSGIEGRSVRRVDRNDLDNETPEWRSSPQSDTALRYVASTTDPTTFHVFPPSTGSANAGLSLVASVNPTKVTSMADAFPIDEVYATPVANYILFRAFMKQVESQSAQSRAADFLQLFNSQMGITDKALESRNAEQRQEVPR